MAVFEVVALDTTTPQLRAPGAGDTYTMPRDVAVTGTVTATTFSGELASGAATSGHALIADGAGGSAFGAVSASPAGSDTQVMFNDGGAFGGDSGLMFNKTTDVLSITGGVNLGTSGYLVGGTNTVELRNSTNAQTFNLYNTYTDASNYERGFMRWATNVLEIGTEKAGTGTQRTLVLVAGTDARSKLTLTTEGGYDAKLTTTLDFYVSPSRNTFVTGTGGLYVTSGDTNKQLSLTSSLVQFGNYADDGVIQGHTRSVDEARRALYIKGGPQHASATTNLVGGHVYVQGGLGASASAGNAHGGNIYLRGGQGYGTGHHGYLYLGDSNTGGISFFNATPVAQQSGTGETTGFTAGAGTNVTDQSTFTGNVGSTAYRISDVVKALKNYGLLAA